MQRSVSRSGGKNTKWGEGENDSKSLSQVQIVLEVEDHPWNNISKRGEPNHLSTCDRTPVTTSSATLVQYPSYGSSFGCVDFHHWRCCLGDLTVPSSPRPHDQCGISLELACPSARPPRRVRIWVGNPQPEEYCRRRHGPSKSETNLNWRTEEYMQTGSTARWVA